MERKSLIGLPFAELMRYFKAYDLTAMQARQTWEWMYRHGVRYFKDMTNLSLSVRKQLEQVYSCERLPVQYNKTSTDGTQKWLFRLENTENSADDTTFEAIETVFIPEETRATICLSSQVGCALQCRFCRTGTQGYTRNLTLYEIVAQVLSVKDAIDDWPKDPLTHRLKNIVFMGMGEPLLNYEALKKVLEIFMDPHGLAFSRHRITVSTSGITPMLERLARECRVPLALSLHASSEALRSDLMPINEHYPLKDLMQAVRMYPALSGTDKVTIEYALLKGINDSPADARALLSLLRGIPAKVNLLTLNPWEGAPFTPSSPQIYATFSRILTQGGIDCFRRRSRGQDILAACGQLRANKVYSTS
ncbi:MAG: 23S rRNA (adenine(2503)-C(2))-methyltransferase RlmN [Holosporales bacterium]|jgi:23S rRNA (adenine2503-C2)-methyltransferase|nr:23S rRNA (adenine(2503)-C(2))-methyltransferase RlmN [Holosporales bacterium]